MPITRGTSGAAFILSCHRSGSTLLRYLLDAHRLIACPPESKFVSGLHLFLSHPQTIDGLRSLGVTESDVLGLVRDLCYGVFSAYCEKQGKQMWVDKTPNYAHIAPFIDAIFDATPKYILFTRHPFDCVVSLGEFFQEVSSSHPDQEIRFAVQHYGQTRAGWAKYWRDTYEHISAFWADHSDRCILVRYEDLVQNPLQEMRRVFTFLRAKSTDKEIADICVKAFNIEHTRGFQDTKISATQGVHRNSLCRFKDWPSSDIEACWRIVGAVASHLGYCKAGR